MKTNQYANRINMKLTILLFTFFLLIMSALDTYAQTPGRRVVKHSNYRKDDRTDKNKKKNEQPKTDVFTSTPQTYVNTPVSKETMVSQDNEPKVTITQIEKSVENIKNLCPVQIKEGLTLDFIKISWDSKYEWNKKIECVFVVDKKAGDFRKNLRNDYYYAAKKELLNLFNKKCPSLMEYLKTYNMINEEDTYMIRLYCRFAEGKPGNYNRHYEVTIEPSEM